MSEIDKRLLTAPNRTDKPWAKHDFIPYPKGHACSSGSSCVRCGRHRLNPNYHNTNEPKESRPTPLPVAEIDLSAAQEHMMEDNGRSGS